MLNLKGLVHFTIPVSDGRRSEEFYTKILGMELIFRTPPALGIGMVFLRCGKDYLILTDSKTPLNVADDDNILLHHAFAVDSDQFDAAVAELEKNGVRVIERDERDQGVFVGRSAYFHDPDRNVLEIIDLQHAAFRPLTQGAASATAGRQLPPHLQHAAAARPPTTPR
jgi:catechol 2,3-dioxygenase-like lactoylglutathione lyase family enzyme